MAQVHDNCRATGRGRSIFDEEVQNQGLRPVRKNFEFDVDTAMLCSFFVAGVDRKSLWILHLGSTHASQPVEGRMLLRYILIQTYAVTHQIEVTSSHCL